MIALGALEIKRLLLVVVVENSHDSQKFVLVHDARIDLKDGGSGERTVVSISFE